AILFAPLGVAAGRLDVTVRARANPDVRIGRRDCKLADALERGLVAHRLAVRSHECEALAGPLAPNAGLLSETNSTRRTRWRRADRRLIGLLDRGQARSDTSAWELVVRTGTKPGPPSVAHANPQK